MALVSHLVLEYLVDGPRVSGDDVEHEDPDSERDVERALQRGHLGDDHPGVPHRVAEVAAHHGECTSTGEQRHKGG